MGSPTLTPARRAGRPLPPHDKALPWLRELLLAEPAVELLERTLVGGARIDDLRVRLVRYAPGRTCTVLYEVAIGGERHRAVASLGDAVPGLVVAAAAPPRPAAPVAVPVSRDAHLGALVHWYPHDPAMPVLAMPPAVLRALVGARPEAGAHADTLVYRPGARAVLRIGDVVLKAYATSRHYAAGVRGLQLARALAGCPAAPAPLAAQVTARVTAQAAVDGQPVPRERALATARNAGAMLRQLHGRDDPGLVSRAPAIQLRAAGRSAELVATVAPALARRAQALLARLELAAPEVGAALVVSHGDFNVSQLLDADGELVLLDFDEACRSAPALDLAAFASNVVSGRDGDLDHARAVLEAAVEGYGARPAGLDWHLAVTLLRRSSSPFRLHKKHWPERTAAILDAAETVLGR